MHDCIAEHGVVGDGPSDAKVMFVGIAPGRHEAQTSHRPFTGPSGKMLDGLLKYVGLARDQVWATNLVCWWNDAPSIEEIKQCLPRFAAEVALVKPKLIVALGTIVSEVLVEPYMTFGKSRAGFWWSTTWDCWMLATYHPAAYLRHSGTDFRIDIAEGVRDFRKAVICLNEDWPKDYAKVDYHVINEVWYPSYLEWLAPGIVVEEPRMTTAKQNSEAFFEHFQRHEGDDVAIDVETKYDGSKMISIAFTCACGTYHLPETTMDELPDFTLLQQWKCKWGFHNGQFDAEQIRKHLHTDLPICEDSMLQSYSLDERGGGDKEADSTGQSRSVGIHGLKRLAREYCAAGYWSDSHVKPEEMAPEDLAEYNSKDAAYTYRLIKRFREMQIADGVREMYETFLIPGANVLSKMHERGAYIDRDALAGLAEEWLPQWLDAEVELQEMAQQMGWPTDDLNLNSPKQLSSFVYDVCKHSAIGKGKAARSTAMAIMRVLGQENTPLGEWATKLLNWRGLDHDISNYILAVDEIIKRTGGRIHPEALIHGTRVGRTAYHEPPVQTMPKERTVGAERARVRRIFAAQPPDEKYPDGYVILEADFRQAELWAATMVSGDKQMLIDLRSGDFHARVAESSFGIKKGEIPEARWELLRDSSKILVYGKFYGAGVDALMGDKALQGRGSTGSYVLFQTREQAMKHIKNFDERYPEYYRWREEEKRKVQVHGEQQSATGRKRRYHMIQDYKQLNQAINMPISSLSHDHIFISMIELPDLLAPWDAEVWFEVHDSIVMHTPLVHLRRVIDCAIKTMSQPRFGFDFGIPVDVKVGPNWYDLHKPEVYLEDSRVA